MRHVLCDICWQFFAQKGGLSRKVADNNLLEVWGWPVRQLFCITLNSVAPPEAHPKVTWSALWLGKHKFCSLLSSCLMRAAYLPTKGHLSLWPCLALTIMTGSMDLSKKRCWSQASSGLRDSRPIRNDMMLSDLRLTSMHMNPLSLEQ